MFPFVHCLHVGWRFSLALITVQFSWTNARTKTRTARLHGCMERRNASEFGTSCIWWNPVTNLKTKNPWTTLYKFERCSVARLTRFNKLIDTVIPTQTPGLKSIGGRHAGPNAWVFVGRIGNYHCYISVIFMKSITKQVWGQQGFQFCTHFTFFLKKNTFLIFTNYYSPNAQQGSNIFSCVINSLRFALPESPRPYEPRPVVGRADRSPNSCKLRAQRLVESIKNRTRRCSAILTFFFYSFIYLFMNVSIHLFICMYIYMCVCVLLKPRQAARKVCFANAFLSNATTQLQVRFLVVYE